MPHCLSICMRRRTADCPGIASRPARRGSFSATQRPHRGPSRRAWPCLADTARTCLMVERDRGPTQNAPVSVPSGAGALTGRCSWLSPWSLRTSRGDSPRPGCFLDDDRVRSPDRTAPHGPRASPMPRTQGGWGASGEEGGGGVSCFSSPAAGQVRTGSSGTPAWFAGPSCQRVPPGASAGEVRCCRCRASRTGR